ncbi:MAG TPA: hypothetical protein PKV96_00170 [Candidatus Saccharimonas sp.]|jgi:hypothetical protein|nr:hypothetical protein [Candidatus Saccharimonas sp.]
MVHMLQYFLLAPTKGATLSSILGPALAVVIVHLIFVLVFKSGFNTTPAGMRRNAILFGIVVLIMAALRGLTTAALSEAVLNWAGYMLGLLFLSVLGLGREKLQ